MAKRTDEQQYIRMTETPVSRLVTSLALPTVGGMLVSTILTLFVVPAIYLYISTERKKEE